MPSPHGKRCRNPNTSVSIIVSDSFGLNGTGSDLAANAKVRVGNKLRLLMAVALLLQERVQHAHSYTRQGDHKGQDLPCLSCRKKKNKVLIHK